VRPEQVSCSLSDSQAAIAAVKKAGRMGKARTADLRRVLMDIKERQTRLGPNAVSFGWVKAYNDVYGNEQADQLAKAATNIYPEAPQITVGGLKQAWKKMREEERRVKGAGIGGDGGGGGGRDGCGDWVRRRKGRREEEKD